MFATGAMIAGRLPLLNEELTVRIPYRAVLSLPLPYRPTGQGTLDLCQLRGNDDGVVSESPGSAGDQGRPGDGVGFPAAYRSVAQQVWGDWRLVGAGLAAVPEGVRLATVSRPVLGGDRGDQSPAVDRRQQRQLPGRAGDRVGAAAQARRVGGQRCGRGDHGVDDVLAG